METKLTYDQLWKTLFLEGIEEYVPDGASISHPVVDRHGREIVDCFLLYSASSDGRRYTAPVARIVIQPETGRLIRYKTVEEDPFAVRAGKGYFSDDIPAASDADIRAAELEYQDTYMKVRTIAFQNAVSADEKELLVRYLKALKKVERTALQPYLFELGEHFFQWVKEVL